MATPKDEKLQALEDEIDDARRQAQDDGLLEDPDHPQRFFESGESVAPPG